MCEREAAAGGWPPGEGDAGEGPQWFALQPPPPRLQPPAVGQAPRQQRQQGAEARAQRPRVLLPERPSDQVTATPLWMRPWALPLTVAHRFTAWRAAAVCCGV